LEREVEVVAVRAEVRAARVVVTVVVVLPRPRCELAVDLEVVLGVGRAILRFEVADRVAISGELRRFQMVADWGVVKAHLRGNRLRSLLVSKARLLEAGM
jgi:hypothetical protein